MTEPAATSILKLPAILDSPAAAGLREAILGLRGQPLDLDASDVDRASTPCLQVLLAASATWRADGHDFRVAAASPAFTDAIGLFGITSDQLPMGQTIP